jgi:ribonuclease R
MSTEKKETRKKRPGGGQKSGTDIRTAGRRKPKQPSGHTEGSLSVTARGFGFVSPIKGQGQDIFIPLENMGTAMDGDKVSVEVLKTVPGKNPVGRIASVTKPASFDIVGVFHREGKKSYVVPNDERFKRNITIPQGGRGTEAKNGQFVLVRREKWDDPRQDPTGRIVEIIGDTEEPGIDTLIIAKSKGLRIEFPSAVLKETQKLSLPSLNKEKHRRMDLRDRLCFTIDPDSAEDFDDAVSLVQKENGRFELGVHIADVSHYVHEESALDKEALSRGTSVYFVDKVLPMLPEKLSNELCSLKEGEDRLAFSVLMEIDSRGTVTDYRITESIIRSDHRFTYREVEEIINGKSHPHQKTINLMMMLSLVLRRAREEQGSIDFDVPVPVISLDANGIPYEVGPSERLDANRLIEEFMLAANQTVARHMVELNRRLDEESSRGRGQKKKGRTPASDIFPFVYRIHEKPEENEVSSFLDLLQRLGIRYRVPGELEAEDYRKILGFVENLDFKDFAEKVALRSMTKAVYSTENAGHFGLAFDAYTHFTSPIRRYPDLLVHRLLKRCSPKGGAGSTSKNTKGNKKGPAGPAPADVKAAASAAAALPDGFVKQLQQVCKSCTEREIRAVDAEREHSKLKAMEFLAGKVGEHYEGMIAGITSFGFFVELNHYLIEGLVHVSELRDDHYEFDKDNYALTGQKNGKVYRLGDPVRVKIKNVSVEERKADFVLADGKKKK